MLIASCHSNPFSKGQLKGEVAAHSSMLLSIHSPINQKAHPQASLTGL